MKTANKFWALKHLFTVIFRRRRILEEVETLIKEGQALMNNLKTKLEEVFKEIRIERIDYQRKEETKLFKDIKKMELMCLLFCGVFYPTFKMEPADSMLIKDLFEPFFKVLLETKSSKAKSESLITENELYICNTLKTAPKELKDYLESDKSVSSKEKAKY